jgi:uncharacterized protein YkwD
MSVRRLFLLLVLVTGMLVLPAPADAGPRTDAAFIRATNADRQRHHRRSLVTSPTLARLARSHSAAMARRSARRYRGRCDARALWHNDISKARDRWVWLGQNVGCGTLGPDGVTASVRRIQRAFMASPGHRRNVLYRRANRFGVGTHVTRGVIWVTVNFEQTRPSRR